MSLFFGKGKTGQSKTDGKENILLKPTLCRQQGPTTPAESREPAGSGKQIAGSKKCPTGSGDNTATTADPTGSGEQLRNQFWNYSGPPQASTDDCAGIVQRNVCVPTRLPTRKISIGAVSADKIFVGDDKNRHVSWSDQAHGLGKRKDSAEENCVRPLFPRLREGSAAQEDRGRGVIPKTAGEAPRHTDLGEPKTTMPFQSVLLLASGVGDVPKTSLRTALKNRKRHAEGPPRVLPFRRRQGGEVTKTSVSHRDNNRRQPASLADLLGNPRTSRVHVSAKQKGQDLQRIAFRAPKSRPSIRDEVFTSRLSCASRRRWNDDSHVDAILGTWLRENASSVPSLGKTPRVSKQTNATEQQTTVLKSGSGGSGVLKRTSSKRDQRFAKSLGLEILETFNVSSFFGSSHSRCWDEVAEFDDSHFTTHAPRISTIRQKLFDDIIVSNVFSEHQLDSYRYLYDVRMYKEHSQISSFNFRYPKSSITDSQHSCLLCNEICEASFDPETSFAYIFTTPEIEKARYRVVTDCLSSNVLCQDSAKTEFTPIRRLGQFILAAKVAVAVDMKAWYFQFKLDPKVRKYFQYMVNGSLFQFCRLPMGFKNSGSIAHQTAVYLALISCEGLEVQFDVYIDNIIFFGNDATLVDQVLQRFKSHCNYYQCVIGEVSDISTSITYRGVQMDFLNKTLRLGTKFRNKFLYRLSRLSGSWAQYRSLIGMLISGYMSLNIPLAEIYYCLKYLARNAYTPEATQVQPWAAVVAELEKATKLFTDNVPRTVTSNPHNQIVVITDACGENSTGASIVITPNGRIYIATYDLDSPSSSINDLETLVLFHTLKKYPFLFNQTLIHAYADNTAMIATLTTGHSKSWFLNMAVRNTLALVNDYRSRLALTYVPSELNPSDGLSRDKGFSTQDRRRSKSIAALAFDNFRRRLAEAV